MVSGASSQAMVTLGKSADVNLYVTLITAKGDIKKLFKCHPVCPTRQCFTLSEGKVMISDTLSGVRHSWRITGGESTIHNFTQSDL